MRNVNRVLTHIEQKRAEIQHNRSKAARAVANLFKVVMRREAPYSAGSRDVARKKGHVKHLRGTITVKPGGLNAGNVSSFTVGPRSRLAHIIVRGTKPRHEVVGGSDRAGLAAARQLRFNARGFQGPKFGGAKALAWSDGGGTIFAHSSNPGPMPRNDFISRTFAIANPEAKAVAGAVLLHDAPDPNEGS